MSKKALWIVIIALIVVAALIFAFTRSSNFSISNTEPGAGSGSSGGSSGSGGSGGSGACDADVFECSDGSFVSRDANNNCEFRTCPGSQNNNQRCGPAGGSVGGLLTFEVSITDSGFSPQNLNILAGDTVKFVNQKSSSSWPASAVHPTHTAYPGSDIQKCGTSEQSTIFDACRGLQTGESWSFTFNPPNTGTWNYHDHLNPSMHGSVTVSGCV